MGQFATTRLVWLLLAAASAILAYHPVLWLWQSWTSAAYASDGYLYALILAGLALRSLLSGPAARGSDIGGVLVLLGAAACLRLLGQIFAVNIASAVALAVDVFAIVRLLRLPHRPFALSPVWMALLFLFALPVEAVVERVLGFPLQLVSAGIACNILGAVFTEVACAGTRITVAGTDVLVDLPCSGAEGLLLALALSVAMNAIQRPRMTVGIALMIAVGLLAVVGNAVRICLLAGGLAHGDRLGLDVMAEPVHSAVGLLTLALSVAPVLIWHRPRPVILHGRAVRIPDAPDLIRLFGAGVAVIAAIAITQAPAKPVDVSGPVAEPRAPHQIAGHLGEDLPLSPMEVLYFTRYGGRALKRQYGPLGLNLVATRSPLRHLHQPEDCLRGLGFSVTFLGTRHTGTPSTVYRAVGPDGATWLVSVSFASDRGDLTPSVAEAIWKWLQDPGATWTSVQRITPIGLPDSERARLDRGILAALDIPTSS